MRGFMDGFSDDTSTSTTRSTRRRDGDPHPMGLVSSGNLRLATGNGPWEHPAHVTSSHARSGFKGIHHHLDDWGPLGGHDWPSGST
jgi:hypothetical protein